MVSVRYQVQARNRTYTVVDDVTSTYHVLIDGTVLDEVTGEALSRTFTVRVDRDDLYVKRLAGGLFCLAGYPDRVFPELDAMPYSVDVAITAPNYRAASLTVTIPQDADFPVAAPPIRLRPLPVRIQGRVVENTTARAPVAGARIISVDNPSPPAPLTEHALLLRSPARFDHAGGITVRQRPLTPSGGAKQLTATAPAGGLTLQLDNRTGLSASSVLRVGPDLQVEYGVIDAVGPPADLTQPGSVTLRSGLKHTFATATVAQPVTPGAVGATRTLLHEANVDDGILILDDVLDTPTIEIHDPPNRVAYHAVGALTDGDGFYRVDGVGRLDQIFLRAGAAGFIDEIVARTVNYDRPVNVVDFRLAT